VDGGAYCFGFCCNAANRLLGNVERAGRFVSSKQ